MADDDQNLPDAYRAPDGTLYVNLRKHATGPEGIPGVYDATADSIPLWLSPVPYADLVEVARLGRSATLDPGSFVGRGYDPVEEEYERLDRWQERAMVAAVERRERRTRALRAEADRG